MFSPKWEATSLKYFEKHPADAETRPSSAGKLKFLKMLSSASTSTHVASCFLRHNACCQAPPRQVPPSEALRSRPQCHNTLAMRPYQNGEQICLHSYCCIASGASHHHSPARDVHVYSIQNTWLANQSISNPSLSFDSRTVYINEYFLRHGRDPKISVLLGEWKLIKWSPADFGIDNSLCSIKPTSNASHSLFSQILPAKTIYGAAETARNTS